MTVVRASSQPRTNPPPTTRSRCILGHTGLFAGTKGVPDGVFLISFSRASALNHSLVLQDDPTNQPGRRTSLGCSRPACRDKENVGVVGGGRRLCPRIIQTHIDVMWELPSRGCRRQPRNRTISKSCRFAAVLSHAHKLLSHLDFNIL